MLYNIPYHSSEKCSEQRNNFKGGIFYVRHVIYGTEHDKSQVLGCLVMPSTVQINYIYFFDLCFENPMSTLCHRSDDFQQQTTQHKNVCEAVTCYQTYYSIRLGKISYALAIH
jgi:hypothetical protein